MICDAYAKANRFSVRIMATKLNYIVEESRHELSNVDISETFIEIEDLNQIISQLEIY